MIKNIDNTEFNNYFQHGVASGDALYNQVIIWTRLTIPIEINKIEVNYEISLDNYFQNLVTFGIGSTSYDDDYTLKIDVRNLSPLTVYYYRFKFKEIYSPIGRTKTAPLNENISSVKFAMVSCSHLQDGYLSAYYHLANQNYIDFVIHLGDSIYEYGSDHKDSPNPIPPKLSKPKKKYIRSIHNPSYDCVTLQDYRARYKQYLEENEYQMVNSKHCFYFTWDDHESADNSFKDGASNHNPITQGDWNLRFSAARQAWFEYHPVRNTNNLIYRSVPYGNLLSLYILDERTYRDKQATKKNYAERFDLKRTILGFEQKVFFREQLLKSQAKWKFIVNPVMFSELLLKVPIPKFKFLSKLRNRLGLTDSNKLYLNTDSWDGYVAERNEIKDYIRSNELNNIVFLTGDIHMSLVCEIPYDYQTFSKTNDSIGVEIITPSLTTDNLNDVLRLKEGNFISKLMKKCIKKSNSHLKFIDTDKHGFVIITVEEDFLRTDYWYVSDKTKRNAHLMKGASINIQSYSNTVKILK